MWFVHFMWLQTCIYNIHSQVFKQPFIIIGILYISHDNVHFVHLSWQRSFCTSLMTTFIVCISQDNVHFVYLSRQHSFCASLKTTFILCISQDNVHFVHLSRQRSFCASLTTTFISCISHDNVHFVHLSRQRSFCASLTTTFILPLCVIGSLIHENRTQHRYRTSKWTTSTMIKTTTPGTICFNWLTILRNMCKLYGNMFSIRAKNLKSHRNILSCRQRWKLGLRKIKLHVDRWDQNSVWSSNLPACLV